MIGELFQIDGPLRVLRRVNEDVAIVGNREVAFPPAVDLVQLRRIADGEHISRLPRTSSCCGGTHSGKSYTDSFGLQQFSGKTRAKRSDRRSGRGVERASRGAGSPTSGAETVTKGL